MIKKLRAQSVTDPALALS